jgi:hypothetical protein
VFEHSCSLLRFGLGACKGAGSRHACQMPMFFKYGKDVSSHGKDVSSLSNFSTRILSLAASNVHSITQVSISICGISCYIDKVTMVVNFSLIKRAY